MTQLISISFALYCLTRGAATPSGASALGQKHFTERQVFIFVFLFCFCCTDLNVCFFCTLLTIESCAGRSQ